jgi:hypothetical protein
MATLAGETSLPVPACQHNTSLMINNYLVNPQMDTTMCLYLLWLP